jgi:alpha-1,6-mannosyltransferase
MEAQTPPVHPVRKPLESAGATRWHEIAAAALMAVLLITGFLLAAGAAAYHGGPLLHNHHPLPVELRGVFGPLKIGLSRPDFQAIVIVFTLSYFGVLLLAGSVSKRLAIGAIVALHVIFMLAPALLSGDIFNYIGYARLEVLHHLNAYYHPLSARPTDSAFPYVGWPNNTSAYGPLFTLASLPLAWIGVAGAMWTLKVLMTAASLACVALVWACAKRLRRDPFAAILYFGLNPLLLLFAVGGGHNDLLMLAPMLAGVLYLLRDEARGVLGVVVAVGIKFSAGVLLPFAVIGAKDRRRALLWAVGGLAVIGILAVIIFGSHIANVRGVIAHDSTLETPNNVPAFLLNTILHLGLHRHTQGTIGTIVLVPTLLGLMYWTWRGADWLTAAGWAMFALLATTTWLLPWYPVWWLPIAAVLRSPAQRYVGVALTVLVIALQLPLK